MQQLITIETIPISIRYVKVDPETNENGLAKINNITNNKAKPHDTAPKPGPTPVKADTFVQSGPAGIYNLTYTATAHYAENGNVQLKVRMEDSEANAQVFRHFGRDIQNMIGHILNKDSSPIEFQGVQLNFDFSQLQNVTPGSGNTGNSFTPPDFEVEILERPKVIIKYVGGPIYIPRSADPNYEPPLGVGQPEQIDTKV
ncbi:MAG: hypothetical protein GX215_08385 [Clostridiales Family XIII bacterium]|nr:hypothetical protein [Clostridiales Family XIII bacterium]